MKKKTLSERVAALEFAAKASERTLIISNETRGCPRCGTCMYSEEDIDAMRANFNRLMIENMELKHWATLERESDGAKGTPIVLNDEVKKP